MIKKTITIAAALLVGVTLNACAPVALAVGAGAGVGVAAAREGGLRGAITDKSIYLKISDLWLKKDLEMYRRLSLTVKEGRVLITGAVPNPDMRVDAVRLAWQAEGVRQVINEVKLNDGSGIGSFVKDTAITGNIKTRLTFDKYVQSINYNIETVNGTVYLMGIAQDQKELDRVLDVARNIKYVKDVVSYVRLRGEMPAGALSSDEISSPAPYASVDGGVPASGVPAVEAPTELH